ncbi:rCG61729 [Rattus norvegicus]|uniref:RCG61729 n=1 Tax=Rattus norvegicus TaxID=10116 RepID=A6HBF4_RAT|nr:rCG61729 [Rattus norvegicus]
MIVVMLETFGQINLLENKTTYLALKLLTVSEILQCSFFITLVCEPKIFILSGEEDFQFINFIFMASDSAIV